MIIGLVWGIIAFMLNKQDKLKNGFFNHLGQIKDELGKLRSEISSLNTWKEGTEKRMNGIERKIGSG